jgi:RNA polymerase sigma-70 factor (ECF subfamily)
MGTMADADGFDAFYRAEWGRLAGTLRLLGGERDAADDVAQEAMTRAWVHWSRVSRLDRPAGWLYVTAFRLQRRRLRREANRPWPEPVPEGGRGSDVDRLALDEALRALPLRARQAVVARHVLGLDGPEAAALLGVSPDAFRQILRRALQTLRVSPELVEEES